ncbi:hypothetical protein CAPTEDRAFT_169717 [Capitella teleta]|uniref:NF-kappa-B-repressing factor n=1 Tax=Capitella teleta TaxID=283909 RepID=R7TLE4_CAPTE|nr:hypothetical protein CAPTEDRAFT_169717 [Capitella teleta]|eukprot:ELT92361.1 hypothetical protein CAPTEDRAFT_169717 [Capitella teleta]
MDLETFNPEKIESYRHAHESSTEWELRKKFLLAHHERFSADRLACLACCFINVECYGCTYPEGVMLQLKELALDIMVDIQQHRDTIQSQRDMKFVNAGGGNQGNARGEPCKKKTKLSPERDAHKSEKSTQNEFQAKEAKFIKLAAAVAKYSKNCADNVMQHLSVAVDKSKMKMTCDFQDIASGGFACHVSIDGVLILGKTNAPTQALPGTNIGSIMMQKMGWTGGGIGREGREGRADPVAVEGVLCRQGLGLSTEQGVTPAFRQKISHLVSEYAVSAKDEDMSFASDFSKDERAAIHKECQKFGLKTHSHGKGEQRYLVVSRKRNKQQLVEHLMQKGGETSKYVLLPPATLNPSF